MVYACTMTRQGEKSTVAILHNIRSAHNAGSIFRTAECAGTARIILSGYTPAPVDRFGRANADIAKTALGAEKTVLWQHTNSLKRCIDKLKKEGYMIVGVEQDARAKDYRRALLPKPTAFIFGNEVRGISKQTLALCDTVIHIPMHGTKESLNVSVAAGIILFHFTH